MTEYVAFFRGINVGGKTVRMGDLEDLFISLRFTNVKTVLASGNVFFSSKEENIPLLKKELETVFAKHFGFTSTITLRTQSYLRELVQSNPFKNVEKTITRLNVSFLSGEVEKTLLIPYTSTKKDFQIISLTENEVFSIMMPEGKTTDMMTFLDKQFGKEITTRNWNTVKQISQR